MEPFLTVLSKKGSLGVGSNLGLVTVGLLVLAWLGSLVLPSPKDFLDNGWLLEVDVELSKALPGIVLMTGIVLTFPRSPRFPRIYTT